MLAKFTLVTALAMTALAGSSMHAGYTNVLGARSAYTAGQLLHPYYPYNSVSGAGSSILGARSGYSTYNTVVPSSNVATYVQESVPVTTNTILTGRSINVVPQTVEYTQQQQYVPTVLEARVNLPATQIVSENVDQQFAMPQIDARALFPQTNTEAVVVNEEPEIVHEDVVVVPGTEQTVNAGGQMTQTQSRSEENREFNRNREINTYSVQKDQVNRYLNNLQRINLHKNINTNINTNIRRINNPHVDTEIVNNVRNTIQPEELIYLRRTNTASESSEVRPTVSLSQRTVNLGTSVLPGTSRIVSDQVLPTVSRGLVARTTLPVRYVNNGLNARTSYVQNVATVPYTTTNVQRLTQRSTPTTAFYTVQQQQPTFTTTTVNHPAYVARQGLTARTVQTVPYVDDQIVV